MADRLTNYQDHVYKEMAREARRMARHLETASKKLYTMIEVSGDQEEMMALWACKAMDMAARELFEAEQVWKEEAMKPDERILHEDGTTSRKS